MQKNVRKQGAQKGKVSTYSSYSRAVADAKAGMQDAFTYLYENTYRDKWYIAQKYMRSEADAEDVLQDAYVKAWRNLDQLKEAEKFPGWLSLIVSSTALDALRKKKELPFSAIEIESDEGDAFEYEEEDWRTEYQPEHAYTDKETSELLRELMDALSEEQRFCMLMYYVEEHSVGEIAETIGCSEGTVKSRLNYGRRNLRAKAEELQRRGYTLYGLTAMPFLRALLRAEKTVRTAGCVVPAIDTAQAASVVCTPAPAMQYGMEGAALSATVSAGTAAPAAAAMAGTTGMAIGTKIAIGLISAVLVGGGGYATARHFSSGGEGTAHVTVVSEADATDAAFVVEDPGIVFDDDGGGVSGSDGEGDVFLAENPVFERLQTDTQEEFLRLISTAEEEPETTSWSWIYFDDDMFPELLMRVDYSADFDAEEGNVIAAFVFYGTTAKPLVDAYTGERKTMVFSRGIDFVYDGVPVEGDSSDYFVPEEGVLVDDEIIYGYEFEFESVNQHMDRVLETRVYVMTDPGELELSYYLIRDLSVNGEETYYYAPATTDGLGDVNAITKEEYEHLHYNEKKVRLFQ